MLKCHGRVESMTEYRWPIECFTGCPQRRDKQTKYEIYIDRLMRRKLRERTGMVSLRLEITSLRVRGVDIIWFCTPTYDTFVTVPHQMILQYFSFTEYRTMIIFKKINCFVLFPSSSSLSRRSACSVFTAVPTRLRSSYISCSKRSIPIRYLTQPYAYIIHSVETLRTFYAIFLNFIFKENIRSSFLKSIVLKLSHLVQHFVLRKLCS